MPLQQPSQQPELRLESVLIFLVAVLFLVVVGAFYYYTR